MEEKVPVATEKTLIIVSEKDKRECSSTMMYL